MSDSLKASVEKLRQSTARLNKITDEAAQVVQALEAFLNKECSVGLDSCVEVSCTMSDESEAQYRTYLGYQRWQGKFRITVSVGSCREDDETKPWAEWDRAIKLETVKKLPELLEIISVNVEEHVNAAKHATETVAEVLKAIDRKGAK